MFFRIKIPTTLRSHRGWRLPAAAAGSKGKRGKSARTISALYHGGFTSSPPAPLLAASRSNWLADASRCAPSSGPCYGRYWFFFFLFSPPLPGRHRPPRPLSWCALAAVPPPCALTFSLGSGWLWRAREGKRRGRVWQNPAGLQSCRGGCCDSLEVFNGVWGSALPWQGPLTEPKTYTLGIWGYMYTQRPIKQTIVLGCFPF